MLAICEKTENEIFMKFKYLEKTNHMVYSITYSRNSWGEMATGFSNKKSNPVCQLLKRKYNDYQM